MDDEKYVSMDGIGFKIIGVMVVTALIAPVCIAVAAFFLSSWWKSL